MKIELNGIPLDKEDEGGTGRSVTNIATEDARNVESYDSPGTQGSSYRDLGRTAVKVALEGTITGKDAGPMLESIWSCFKKGDPVEFRSDISGAADITKVLIDSFTVRSAAGDRDKYGYSIELWEYREPPEEPDIPGSEAGEGGGEPDGSTESKAKEWADGQARDAEKKANVLKGVILDVNGSPAKGIAVRIRGERVEVRVETDEKGEYRVGDLEPGKYVITVEAEGYEGQEEAVQVG